MLKAWNSVNYIPIATIELYKNNHENIWRNYDCFINLCIVLKQFLNYNYQSLFLIFNGLVID